ncbi:MAG: amidohydrolase [Crocinitomicaceae bacterium]|nr:amidohydrolase [Crocinitomicaceae bacterium]
MQDLKVCLIQTSIIWENKEANFAHLEKQFLSKIIPGQCDLILLPEMFNTGFSMNTEALAEEMTGQSILWLQKWAEKLDCQIAATLIITVNKSFYNRFVFVSKIGIETYYDKRHLFRMAEENNYFSAGQNRVIHSIKGWNILPQVCYDLRFPVFSRNKTKADQLEYDLVIYLANWPKRRAHIWSVLLKARAIENQAYCIGVNRVGIDGKEIDYSGNSEVIDPWGNTEYLATDSREEVKILTLAYQKLTEIKALFPAFKDSD